MASPTKTTSIDQIDAWQVVAAGTLITGNADSIADAYDAICYIEAALTGDASASDGIEIIVEVSYAADDWVTWAEVKGTAEDPATTKTADDPLAAEASVVNLDDSSTGDFDVPGRKWFILDGTGSNSESVRTESDDGSNAVTLCQDTLRQHAVDSDCFDRVDDWAVKLPMAASQFRVLYNNVDATCACHVTTRVSKTTALK